MLKNYFKIALRSLLRDKSYTFINVTGLALGITTCLIIFLIIHREFSIDTFHADHDRIYRVVDESKTASGIEKTNVTPYPFANGFRNDFPEINDVTEFHYQEQILVTIDGEKSNVTDIIFADSSFFDIFGFEVLSGNPKKELAQPGKVFLSEEYAAKLRTKDTKHIKLNNMLDLEVVGIIKKSIHPSHITFNMIVSWPSLSKEFLTFPITEWGLHAAAFTYIKLPPNMHREQVEKRFPDFVKKYHSPEEANHLQYFLQPLSEAHFNTEYTGNPGEAATSITTVYILGFIGLFILIIACVNFVNLATALSIKKSKEVGVRKTLGARQGQLAFQYMSEALLLTFTAAIISICLAEIAVPFTSSFLKKDFQLNFFHNMPVIVFLICLILFTALVSGLYPSLVLARFNPVRALKNKIADPGSSSSVLRKSLVVFQFFIAQVLIICTLVVSSQINFFRTKPLGFSKEAIINVPLPENKPEILEALRNKLATNSSVQDVSVSVGAPISDNNFGTSMYLTEKGKTDQYTIGIKLADVHYKDVYGLELLEGRWFLESDEKLAAPVNQEDKRFSYVITESAVKALGFASPKDIIGKNITTGLNDINAPVIGVLKDFNSSSLKEQIKPIVLFPYPELYYDAGIKISTTNMPATLKFVEETWHQLFPNYLFEYSFLDQYAGKLYEQEERMFMLFEVFAGIAILIGCLGLYGLASFMANQKTKEVAIRKTLGASVSQIIALFSREFVLLVILAFVFAAPVAWYAMRQWLDTFAYRVDMGWTVFVIGIVFTLFIAFTTVGYRSLRAALSNPVNALKSE